MNKIVEYALAIDSIITYNPWLTMQLRSVKGINSDVIECAHCIVGHADDLTGCSEYGAKSILKNDFLKKAHLDGKPFEKFEELYEQYKKTIEEHETNR